MSFLLDTNVLSELRKGALCDRHVKAWFDPVPEDHLFTSVLCLGEIRRGIEAVRPRDQAFASRLETWLDDLIESFGPKALPVDLEAALRWGIVQSGATRPQIDSLLAATAIAHDITLVTRNTKDIRGFGVRLVNPFEPQQ